MEVNFTFKMGAYLRTLHVITCQMT